MRHRYRVDLYDDVVLEAQVADLVASMPRARRQEFLRTMIKVGFLNTYGVNATSESHVPSLPKESLPRKDDGQHIRVNDTSSKSPNATDKSPVTEPNKESVSNKKPHSINSKSTPSSVKEAEDPSKNNNFDIPSINSEKDLKTESDNLTAESAESNGSDDDIVDGLDEFNGLFDGLSES